MNANIGSMLRAMMGETQPTESVRALELKIGQIVRGVLLQMLDEREAVINVNGVKVRATLDAEMPVGKGTLLQVMPDSQNGLIVLKPLAETSESVPDETVRNALKSFGLPEHDWANELVRGLKRDGFALDRDAARWFRQAAEAKPANVGAQEWMNAAGVAFRRGLEPSETTIASLRQALFGQPMHAQLAEMRTLAGEFAASVKPGSPAAETIGQLQRLLAQGAALLDEGAAPWTGDASEAPAGRRADGGASGGPNPAGAKPERADAAGPNAAFAALPQAENGAERAGRAAGSGPLPQQPAAPSGAVPRPAGETAAGRTPLAAAMGGAETAETDAARQAGPDERADGSPRRAVSDQAQRPPAPVAAPNQGNAAPAASQETARTDEAQRAAVGQTGRDAGFETAAQRPAAESADRAEPWIGRFLQWLGVGHERQALMTAEAANGWPAPGGGDPSPAQDAAKAGETLKGALLALASQEDVPQALREAAGNLAQQIAGQQLLLSPERQNATLLSHMTFFVPLKNADGETTATIHVQTRRGRKGEWDSDNCRLLFDLKMSHLGDTLVDVAVVDKVVSLRLLNDRPWVAELVETAKEEAAEGLRSAGYQLLSLKAAPFPKPIAEEGEPSKPDVVRRDGSADKTLQEPYASKLYKGVDFRA
ncbi:hypothetical protein [Cohnella massiliensis]|uniref:hypothetical protein n=1 Tax=Cohnella massiliensis TaxID=1816691 RepID=UPI0009BC309B|nr:hypothetical protein [Cohnella massiliensis]